MLALLLASAHSMSAREWWDLSPTYLNVTAIVCTVVLLWFGAHYLYMPLYRGIVRSKIAARLEERRREKERMFQESAIRKDREDDKARDTIELKNLDSTRGVRLTASKHLADRIRESARGTSVIVQ